MRLLTTTLFTLTLACTAYAGVGISINIGSAPYYGYAPPQVAYVQQYVPAYDMPRVFVISRYARVQPTVVVDLYRRGYGWNNICARYGVPMAAFASYYPPPRPVYYRAPMPPPRYYAPPPARYYGPGYGRGYARGYARGYHRGYDRGHHHY